MKSPHSISRLNLSVPLRVLCARQFFWLLVSGFYLAFFAHLCGHKAVVGCWLLVFRTLLSLKFDHDFVWSRTHFHGIKVNGPGYRLVAGAHNMQDMISGSCDKRCASC